MLYDDISWHFTLLTYLLLIPQSGIHCLTVCAIKLLSPTSFDTVWKSTCLPVVSVSLTVVRVVFSVFTLYKCTFTYFLTVKRVMWCQTVECVLSTVDLLWCQVKTRRNFSRSSRAVLQGSKWRNFQTSEWDLCVFVLLFQLLLLFIIIIIIIIRAVND